MATTRRRSSSRKRSSSKRGSQKRGTVEARNATFYAKRSSRGRFREMDEQGRARRRPASASSTDLVGHGEDELYWRGSVDSLPNASNAERRSVGAPHHRT